jgi:hypothetical protein
VAPKTDSKEALGIAGSHLGNTFKQETDWWVDAVSVFLKIELWVYVPALAPGGAARSAKVCSLNAQLRGLQRAPCFASAIED